MKNTSKSQRGVILIEALIGMLIFSIGILALIGMQATAMKNTTDARYRSEAAFLANQIIGQIWVDKADAASYASPTHPKRHEWDVAVEAMLPGIDVAGGVLAPTIEFDAAKNNMVTVTVHWKQPGESAPHKVQMTTWING